MSLHLRADPLGLLFALVASMLWLLTSVYSVGYMRAGGDENQTGYFSSFATCISATIGLAFAANLLTFFLFYEVLTLATYPLVAHKRTPEARAGGRTYLVFTLTAGQALLLAIVWTQSLAPGGEFRPGGLLPPALPVGTVLGLFGLFIVGVGVKAAIMPLHGWLPAAMVAPTPVSALLHAVAVVKAGAFGCLRVVGYVFGVDLLREVGADTILAVLAGTTIVLASLRALGETHLKRRLAYSTVSQLSYIVLGAALGSVAALAGAMFHIAAHGFMKITMFFCAGAIHTESHRDDVSQFRGLGRQMPITMTAFAIGAAGLPERHCSPGSSASGTSGWVRSRPVTECSSWFSWRAVSSIWPTSSRSSTTPSLHRHTARSRPNGGRSRLRWRPLPWWRCCSGSGLTLAPASIVWPGALRRA